MELRSIMRPYTAANLKERKYNRPQDYLQVAGLLGVTHVAIVSQTESNTIYKIARAPQGPTLHFKVLKYSLMKHVRALQKHPFESQVAYQTPPLVVLNNFGQASASHIAVRCSRGLEIIVACPVCLTHFFACFMSFWCS
jgi:ribosome biogenesis protein SSF1/2